MHWFCVHAFWSSHCDPEVQQFLDPPGWHTVFEPPHVAAMQLCVPPEQAPQAEFVGVHGEHVPLWHVPLPPPDGVHVPPSFPAGYVHWLLLHVFVVQILLSLQSAFVEQHACACVSVLAGCP
jgi:hypothetical protein